jgi:lactate racemase
MIMKTKISYKSAKGEQEINIDFQRINIEVVSPSVPATKLDDNQIIDFLILPFEPGKGTLYIINDLDRPTPTVRLLTLLEKRYPKALLGDVLVATGAHKLDSSVEDVGKKLLGGLYGAFLGRIFFHDSRNDPTVLVGKTPKGTVVEVSQRLFEYEKVVAIGSVEPHWFAGYTGGRKSLVPGIASFETIRQNHSLALADGVGPLITFGNPLYEDLDDATDLVVSGAKKRVANSTIVGVNTISKDDDIFGISNGPILGHSKSSISSLFDKVNEIYIKKAKPADITFDIAIAIAEAPMDRDLYQAMKSFENVRGTIKRGGSYILVASCIDGIGPPHFAQTMALSADKNDFENRLSGEYRLGDHKFKNPLDFIKDGGTISVVSEELLKIGGTDGVGFTRIFDNLDDALETEMRRHDSGDVKVLVVKDAVNLVVMRY